MIKPIQQAGFTMVELMISIVLGLLITAAGLTIFFAGQRSLSIQNGLSELQQNSIFGLSLITHDLRHVNLNTTAQRTIHPDIAGSGLIFTQRNVFNSSISADFLTKVNANQGLMDKANDQLTIQYMPQYEYVKKGNEYVYTSTMSDCEGRALTDLIDKQVIVQRYYVQTVNGQSNLYCDAGYYVVGTNSIKGIEENKGQLLIPHVEAFKIRLGIKDTGGTLNINDDKFSYSDVATYVAANSTAGTAAITTPKNPNIQVSAVEIGLVTRSTNTVGADANIDADKTFNIAGFPVKLTKPETDADAKYLREEFSQVVAIRNAEGVNK